MNFLRIILSFFYTLHAITSYPGFPCPFSFDSANFHYSCLLYARWMLFEKKSTEAEKYSFQFAEADPQKRASSILFHLPLNANCVIPFHTTFLYMIGFFLFSLTAGFYKHPWRRIKNAQNLSGDRFFTKFGGLKPPNQNYRGPG